MKDVLFPVKMEERTFEDAQSGRAVPYQAFLLKLPSGIWIRIKTVDSTAKELLVAALKETSL